MTIRARDNTDVSGDGLQNLLIKKSIAIGFVIYNPNQEQIDRIKKIPALGFKVYLFDNTPEYSLKKHFEYEGILYFTCGKNVGLGLGMATMCAQAYYNGESALIFFDQDTFFSNETLYFIDRFYKENTVLGNLYSAVVFNSKNKSTGVIDSKKYFRNVSLAINSGSLFFLENLKKINWHNHQFFVDCVDYDFCLNSQIHGFKIGEYSSTPGFDHESEQGNLQYSIQGRIHFMRPYSLARIIDTCSGSLKLLFKAIVVGRIVFFIQIFKFLLIYMGTQLFVRTIGCMFKKRI